jgi:hypothetical protein
VKKDFYKLLRDKLDLGENRGAEDRFLQNFRDEFGETEEKSFGLWAGISSVAAMMVISFLIYRGSYFGLQDDKIMVAAIVQHEALLTNIDMFNELEDIDLTDEDWEILLEETI